MFLQSSERTASNFRLAKYESSLDILLLFNLNHAVHYSYSIKKPWDNAIILKQQHFDKYNSSLGKFSKSYLEHYPNHS